MKTRFGRVTILGACMVLAFGSTVYAVAPSAPTVTAPTQFVPGDDLISPTTGDQTAPAIAKGNDTALAVWSDARALAPIGYYEGETSRDIYGMRLDANGNPLDAAPIAITAAPSNQENPQVVWNGTNWLVVFESYSLGGTGYYYQKSLAAVRVSPNGQVLDSRPIPVYGVMPTLGVWSTASDGNNWVVAFEGASASNDIMAIRISADGVVLDPPIHSFVIATYYTRFNLHLAYAGGLFLLTFNDSYINGTYDTKAVRFDSALTPLDAAPFSLLSVPLSSLASRGTEFYIVWNQQQPDFSMAVTGSRVSTAGQKLDGSGVNISRNNPPQAYTTTDVVWDGTNWKVTWGYNNAVSVARVNASGQLLDPGGVSVSGPSTGPVTATSTGGLQLAWVTFAGNNYDVFTANISAGFVAGPNKTLSIGAPMQFGADVAAHGGGYMMVYRSSTAGQIRILAQPLDAAGAPIGGPIQLDAGDNITGPGAPAVAWDGARYMAAWANGGGIAAQRLNPDGSLMDAAPFVVTTAGFGPVDLEAMGDTFLVVGLQFGYNTQIINPIGVRVRGFDGAVLDAAPKVLGGSYSSKPKVAVLGGRWLAAWQQNATHDDPAAGTMAAFVGADGTVSAPITVYSYSSAGGNSIFDIGLASSGTAALVVQSAEISSGVETDLAARLINADGTLQSAVNLTPWTGNQYRPRAAWDGNQFIVVYQDQRNRLAEQSLEQLDARSDLFGMRLSVSGGILDPQGFVFSASPLAETHPTVVASDGVSLIAGSVMRNESPYANYRIGYRLFGAGGNQWPVAFASASTIGGDVPLTVNFSSVGSTDPDGSIASNAWDFGDGGTSADADPAHTYITGGPFVAGLTATDNGGASTTQTVLVKTVNPNQAPVANASAIPAAGTAPLDVTFYAAGSYDPDGFLGNFYWTFGDGWDYWGSVAYHTFSAPGTYQTTLTVYDSRGATGTQTFTIQVDAAGCAAQCLRSTAITLSARGTGIFTFTGQVTVKDEAGAAVKGATVSAAWTLPDGTTLNQTAATRVNGLARFTTTGGNGTYRLTVTNITKTGYTFDPLNSVLTKTITK